MREPSEEPGVRAILVVDLERDEQTSAERDGGENRGAAKHGDANSDTLCFLQSVCMVGSCRDDWSPLSQSLLGSTGYTWQGSEQEEVITA